MNWKGLFPFEITTDEKPVLNVEKPIAEQLVTSNYQQQYQPTPSYPGIPATQGTGYNTLPPDVQEKWSNHINKVYNDTIAGNSPYKDFLEQTDALIAAIPNEAARISAIGALMKVKGITKTQILNSANNVLKTFGTVQESFVKELTDRNKTDILDNQDAIVAKQQQIQQLNNEIAQLNQNIKDNTVKLSLRDQGFNTYFGGIMQKINISISNITSFITE